MDDNLEKAGKNHSPVTAVEKYRRMKIRAACGNATNVIGCHHRKKLIEGE